MDVKSVIEGYRDELVSRLGSLVAVNSAMGTPEDGAPFGPGPKKALETALSFLQEDAIKQQNLLISVMHLRFRF